MSRRSQGGKVCRSRLKNSRDQHHIHLDLKRCRYLLENQDLCTQWTKIKESSNGPPTLQLVVWATQFQWEWFHSGCSDPNTYGKQKPHCKLPQKSPPKDDKKKNSRTVQAKMWGPQLRWEWFHLGCFDSIPYNKSPENKLPQKHPQRTKKTKSTHNMVKDVSIPISVGMVPLKLFWDMSL